MNNPLKNNPLNKIKPFLIIFLKAPFSQNGKNFMRNANFI